MVDSINRRDNAGGWLRGWWWAGLLLVVLRLPWLGAVIERDEGLFAYVGWVLADGGVPYVDVIDHHGLSLYVMWGISFELFGTTVLPVRLLVLGLHVLMVGAVYRLGRDWFGERTGSTAALLLALFAALPIFEGHYGMTEPLSTPLMVFGWLAYEQSRQKQTPIAGSIWYAVAWLLVALASSIRLVQAMAGVALCGVVIVDTLYTAAAWRRRVWHLLWRGLLAVAMVGAVWGTIIVVLYWWGALGAFWQIITESFVYGTQASYIAPALQGVLLRQGLPLFGLMLAGFAGLIMRVGQWQRVQGVLLWWVLVYVWVVTRPQMYGHYFFQLLPAGALLSAVGVQWLYRVLDRFSYSHKEWILISGVGLLCLPSVPLAIAQYPNMHLPAVDYYYADSVSYSHQKELATLILDFLEAPNDRVYIYGNEPAMYWLIRRRAPVSDTFAINHYQWVVHAHGDTPPLAVVRHNETRIVVLYDRYLGGTLDDVSYFVTQAYERVGRVDGATVYRQPAVVRGD